MPTCTAALVLAVLALAPVVLVSSPQQEQPRPVFKADVELVQIDVSVVDAEGRPIRGLTKDDFSIVDRKRRQRVDTFSEISHIWERPPAAPLADVKSDVSDNSSTTAERVVVLVIDDRNIWQERTSLVRDLVWRLINDLSHEASIAMVFASGRAGVEPTSGVLGRTARVAVAVEVRAPFVAVAEAGGRARDSLSATILAVDLKKKKVTHRVNRQANVLVAEPRVSASGEVSYHLIMAIDLPPGQYQLRTSVASGRLQKAGSVYLAVDVPAAPKSGLAIAGLAVGLASRGSKPVAQTADGPLPIRPVFDRVFSQGDTLRVVYWIARTEARPVVSSRVDILNRQDEIVLTVEGRDEPGVDGLVERAVRLSSLIPGSYRLRVTAGEGVRLVTREIGIAVRVSH